MLFSKKNKLLGGSAVPSSISSPFMSPTSSPYVVTSTSSPYVMTPTSSPYVMSTTSSPYIVTDSILSTDIFSPVSTLTPYSPIISTIPSGPLTLSFDYSKPLVGVYETIDDLPEVRKKMLNYYYDLIRDKWLLDEINDVLNYFVNRDSNISMIKNLNEYDPNTIEKDTDKIAEKKVEYIEKNIFTKYDLTSVLNKFTKETNTKWVDLPKNDFFLRQVVKEYIIREIKKKIKESKKKL
jgi:hypothetical protein